MSMPPKSPFNLHAAPTSDKLRDKDNDALKPTPPSQNRKPAPNLAPTGSLGIKRGLPPKDQGQVQPARTRFSLDEKGKLAKEFKPLSRPDKDRGHGH